MVQMSLHWSLFMCWLFGIGKKSANKMIYQKNQFESTWTCNMSVNVSKHRCMFLHRFSVSTFVLIKACRHHLVIRPNCIRSLLGCNDHPPQCWHLLWKYLFNIYVWPKLRPQTDYCWWWLRLRENKWGPVFQVLLPEAGVRSHLKMVGIPVSPLTISRDPCSMLFRL